MAYIYKHIRKDTNEVFYIGIGKSKNRIKSKDNRNNHWHNIVKKVGFNYEIIEDNLTWEEACELEKYWIKFYGRRDLNEGKLVNMTDGGDGTINFSQEVIEKIRKSAIGRKLSEEHKRKIGKGVSNPSAETRLKMSLANKNKIVSAETKLKLSITNKNCVPPNRKGATHSEETKNKLRELNKGKVVSEETRMKLSEARKKWLYNKNNK